MLRIIIAGNGEKDAFSSVFLSTLKLNEYGYIYAGANGFEISPPLEKGRSFLILESNADGKIMGFNSDIFIIKSGVRTKLNPVKDVLRKDGCVLFDSENKNNLKSFQDITSNIIDCGINEKNTITISSMLEEKITISIQREIKNLAGKKIEPQEFTIAGAGAAEIPALIICAATLLLSKR